MNKFYCQCGCGVEVGVWAESNRRYGQVKGQPKRYVRNHHPKSALTEQERFWAKVDKSKDCWIWTASRRGQYGQFRRRTKQANLSFAAHRLSYEWANGRIPDGLVIDHLCRNTLCVNPAHLEAVTHRENTLRGCGPTAANYRRTHNLQQERF